MSISRRSQLLRLSQTGETFRAVSGASVLPNRGFHILNDGLGVFGWTISSSTLSGGDWLSVSPTHGSSSASLFSSVEVRADPTSLAPGAYYGLLEVAAPEAASSPQFVTVVLHLLPRDGDPGLLVDPFGLLFASALGGGPLQPQQVELSNLTSSPVAFTSRRSTQSGGDWFNHSPEQGTISADWPFPIEVQVDPTGLPAGPYRGVLTLSLDHDSTRNVDIALVVPPGVAATAKLIERHQGLCRRNELAPVFRSLGGTSSLPAGWPAAVEVQVADNCGAPMKHGAVVAEFTNIDSPTLALAHFSDGRWSGTWDVPNTDQRSSATVTVAATDPDGGVGSFSSPLVVEPNPAAAPRIVPGGVVHAASFVEDPLAPGTIVSLFGANLSLQPRDGGQPAVSLPLPTELAGTEVTLGGMLLPLLFSREDQVNALIPFELQGRTNERLPLLVRRNEAISVSQPVFVSDTRPGIFTQDGSGTGAGAIVDVNFRTVTASNPLGENDVMDIFLAGLGQVEPVVPSGEASPGSPLSRVERGVGLL